MYMADGEFKKLNACILLFLVILVYVNKADERSDCNKENRFGVTKESRVKARSLKIAKIRWN